MIQLSVPGGTYLSCMICCSAGFLGWACTCADPAQHHLRTAGEDLSNLSVDYISDLSVDDPSDLSSVDDLSEIHL